MTTSPNPGARALALLRKYRTLIRFAHPFECHDRRGSDCTCGAENAERELTELAGPAPERRMKG